MFDDSKFRYTGRTEVYSTVSDCTQTVPDTDTIREWYEKRADTGKIERWGLEKTIIFIILAVIAFGAAYMAVDFIAVVICAILCLSFGIITDPLHLMRRRVSQKSRLLIGVALLPLLMLVAVPGVRTVIATAIISIVILTIARKGNRHWLAAESYQMSRHVLKALQQYKRGNGDDAKDACSVAWQADGAREVVAVAAEMGAYGCTDIEWYVRKAAYTVGFSRASSISKKLIKEAEANKRDAEAAKDEVKELKARLKELENFAKDYDAFQKILHDAEGVSRDGARAMADLMTAKDKIRELTAKVEKLEQANKDLMDTADNPTFAKDVSEQITEQRLKEAVEKGMSVRQAEVYAGVSHGRAQRYMKEHRKDVA